MRDHLSWLSLPPSPFRMSHISFTIEPVTKDHLFWETIFLWSMGSVFQDRFHCIIKLSLISDLFLKGVYGIIKYRRHLYYRLIMTNWRSFHLPSGNWLGWSSENREMGGPNRKPRSTSGRRHRRSPEGQPHPRPGISDPQTCIQEEDCGDGAGTVAQGSSRQHTESGAPSVRIGGLLRVWAQGGECPLQGHPHAADPGVWVSTAGASGNIVELLPI